MLILLFMETTKAIRKLSKYKEGGLGGNPTFFSRGVGVVFLKKFFLFYKLLKAHERAS